MSGARSLVATKVRVSLLPNSNNKHDKNSVLLMISRHCD